MNYYIKRKNSSAVWEVTSEGPNKFFGGWDRNITNVSGRNNHSKTINKETFDKYWQATRRAA